MAEEGPGKREGQTQLDCSLGEHGPASWHRERRLPQSDRTRGLHTLALGVTWEQSRTLGCSLVSWIGTRLPYSPSALACPFGGSPLLYLSTPEPLCLRSLLPDTSTSIIYLRQCCCTRLNPCEPIHAPWLTWLTCTCVHRTYLCLSVLTPTCVHCTPPPTCASGNTSSGRFVHGKLAQDIQRQERGHRCWILPPPHLNCISHTQNPQSTLSETSGALSWPGRHWGALLSLPYGAPPRPMSTHTPAAQTSALLCGSSILAGPVGSAGQPASQVPALSHSHRQCPLDGGSTISHPHTVQPKQVSPLQLPLLLAPRLAW